MWHKLALLACLALSASAQRAVTDARSGDWTAKLNGPWLWHTGDNLSWASPSFDDSGWTRLSVLGVSPRDRRYWIRIHLESGPMSDPGLLLGPVAYAYDVYWDGQHIGNFGDLSRGKWFVPRWETFHVPRDVARPDPHVIAIRIAQIGVGFGTRPLGLGRGG